MITVAKDQPSIVARTFSVAVKIAALILVSAAVFGIVQYKLDSLKQFNSSITAPAMTAADKVRELECLTRNIYWEAASEPFEGKVAVAQVTLNRVTSGRFADTVCGVVYQKNVIYEKVICQFSWYCENTSRVKPVHRPLWRESEEVAKKVYLEGFRLPSMKEAYYYHADYVRPNWNKPRIGEIGRHIFYGERK